MNRIEPKSHIKKSKQKCFGFFLPLDVQWEADVFQYVFLHEQVKMLENHSYFLSLFAEFFWGKFAEGFSVY